MTPAGTEHMVHRAPPHVAAASPMAVSPAPAPAGPPPSDPTALAAYLARTQGADGSFGGDAHRTAAALLTLVLQGNTRRAGPRSRVVLKAAAWLAAHRADRLVAAALAALDAAERGETPQETPEWAELSTRTFG